MERLVGVRCTKAKELARWLAACGLKVPSPRLRRINSRLGHKPRAGDVVRIKWDLISTGHWVVKAPSGYWDPIFGAVADDFYATKEGRRGKPTSFLRVLDR
jgi:hypothetical protein